MKEKSKWKHPSCEHQAKLVGFNKTSEYSEKFNTKAGNNERILESHENTISSLLEEQPSSLWCSKPNI
jgi:hypothetical protein